MTTRRTQPRTRDTRNAPDTMSPARARVRAAVTRRRSGGRAGGPPGRPSRGGRARRGCRPASSRGSRGRAAPGRRAGPRRRRAGGSRTSGAACGARRRAAGRRPGAGDRAGSAARGRRAGPRVVQEDLGRLRGIGRRAASRMGRPVEVRAQRVARGAPEQADPLLAALAEDADLASPQIERPELGRGQLADAQAGRVGRLDEGAVAERERRGQRGSIRVGASVAARSASTTPSSRVTWSTSRTRGSRRGRRGVAIAPHGSPGGQPFARRPAVERADRGESLGDGRARPGPTRRAR